MILSTNENGERDTSQYGNDVMSELVICRGACGTRASWRWALNFPLGSRKIRPAALPALRMGGRDREGNTCSEDPGHESRRKVRGKGQ